MCAGVGGEPLGQRVGGGVQLAEPARAEVDRVEDQDVAGDVRGRALEEVQRLVEPADPAGGDLGVGIDADVARGGGHACAVEADAIGQHVRTGYGDGPRCKRLVAASDAARAARRLRRSEPAAPPHAAEPVTIALDFVPNPVHAPIYMAGDGLRIRKPGSGPDSLKLVSSGKVELGVLDIHDLAIAREQGSDLVAVAALVGKPLAALIAQPDVARPRDLAGPHGRASPACRRTRRS